MIKFKFPLSLEDVAKLLGDKNEVTTGIDGIVMVKKYHSNPQAKESIKDQIFKTVYDEWGASRSVVLGDNKLLTEINLLDYKVKEQADSIESLIVMRIEATISISQDPQYKEEIKENKKLKQ